MCVDLIVVVVGSIVIFIRLLGGVLVVVSVVVFDASRMVMLDSLLNKRRWSNNNRLFSWLVTAICMGEVHRLINQRLLPWFMGVVSDVAVGVGELRIEVVAPVWVTMVMDVQRVFVVPMGKGALLVILLIVLRFMLLMGVTVVSIMTVNMVEVVVVVQLWPAQVMCVGSIVAVRVGDGLSLIHI